jgi:hypothetical protein
MGMNYQKKSCKIIQNIERALELILQETDDMLFLKWQSEGQ